MQGSHDQLLPHQLGQMDKQEWEGIRALEPTALFLIDPQCARSHNVAQILKTKGYILTCRGAISVKGKGEMVTYFLDATAPKE